jgi:hypothetical protein
VAGGDEHLVRKMRERHQSNPALEDAAFERQLRRSRRAADGKRDPRVRVAGRALTVDGHVLAGQCLDDWKRQRHGPGLDSCDRLHGRRRHRSVRCGPEQAEFGQRDPDVDAGDASTTTLAQRLVRRFEIGEYLGDGIADQAVLFGLKLEHGGHPGS